MDQATFARMAQLQREMNEAREKAHPPDQYDRVDCLDCNQPLYIAKTASDDDQIECGNCGAGYSVDFWRSMEQD